jgi:hypothetical protein
MFLLKTGAAFFPGLRAFLSPRARQGLKRKSFWRSQKIAAESPVFYPPAAGKKGAQKNYALLLYFYRHVFVLT